MPPLLPYVALEQQLDLYRASCAEHGTEPDIVWIHACHLDEDRETAHREAREWVSKFITGNSSPLTEWPKAPADDLNKAGYGFYTAGIMESLAELPYDKLIEDDYVWVGTPADVIERIAATRKVCEGIQEIGITVNAGGAPHWMAIKNQELFASAVMPHVADLAPTQLLRDAAEANRGPLAAPLRLELAVTVRRRASRARRADARSRARRPATARSNTASFARDGFCMPLTFRTYCSAAAWISSCVVGGSKLWRTLMFRHMDAKFSAGGERSLQQEPQAPERRPAPSRRSAPTASTSAPSAARALSSPSRSTRISSRICAVVRLYRSPSSPPFRPSGSAPERHAGQARGSGRRRMPVTIRIASHTCIIVASAAATVARAKTTTSGISSSARRPNPAPAPRRAALPFSPTVFSSSSSFASRTARSAISRAVLIGFLDACVGCHSRPPVVA